VVGDERPAAGYAAAMTEVLGRSVRYRHMPRERVAALGFPGAEELADMFEYYRAYVPSRSADLAASRALYPGLQGFEAWLARHRSDFTSVFAD